MQRDTRQRILNMAQKLFNERGFNAVSTRDIADALEMSKGNLTYYFKKKEEIMEALLTERPPVQRPETPQSLEELDAFFLDMQQVIQNNAFYFWHHAQMAQISPSVKEKQADAYFNSFIKLKKAFETLRDQGIFRREEFEGEYGHLIDTLHLSCIYWIPFHAIKQQENMDGSYEAHAWALLRHLLTEQGVTALDKLLN